MAGVLRIAHGMALHALQILPLLGYAVSRWLPFKSNASRLSLFGLAALAYAAVVFLLYRQAMAGIPLI